MGLASDLLERGWFPRELPPPFTTAGFARAMLHSPQPPEWLQLKPDAMLGTHNLPRHAALRRTVAIVNPTAQFGLCMELEKSWPEIRAVLAASPYSASTPRQQQAGRALERSVSRVDLPVRRALNRSGARWILETDVARCYPSIYTHSIPWAIHTKPTAKADRSPSLTGNRLDAWVRKGQSGQTMGIPIGPDSSLVLAELILSRVDAAIAGKCRGGRILRYMDDYECTASSHSAAMDTLSVLQFELSQFELALNGEKTAVLALPRELQRPWANTLRRLDIRTGTSEEQSDIVAYFDAAFRCASQFQEEPVLNFALARLQAAAPTAGRDSRELLEALLLQSLLLEPGTHRYVINHFTEKLANRPKNKDYVGQTFMDHLVSHARLGHTSEVAWAIWACIALDMTLNAEAARAVGELDDDVVALLALDAETRSLLPGLDTTLWRSFMTKDELRGKHWLLAYEASIKGWLPPAGGKDYLASDACFNWMHQHGVSFYSNVVPQRVPPQMLEPAAAWEDSYSG
jgi:hypothetical protein